jgi:hypothetical protein
MSPTTTALSHLDDSVAPLSAASNDSDVTKVLPLQVISLGDGTCAYVDDLSHFPSGIHSSLYVSMMDKITYWAKAKKKNSGLAATV